MLPEIIWIRIAWLSQLQDHELAIFWHVMILRTGVDLIEISRVSEVIARHGKHYLERIYTSAELEQCGKNVKLLAGRFAAKEAVSKALGTGIGDVTWKEIEILGDEQNAPKLHFVAWRNKIKRTWIDRMVGEHQSQYKSCCCVCSGARFIDLLLLRKLFQAIKHHLPIFLGMNPFLFIRILVLRQ